MKIPFCAAITVLVMVSNASAVLSTFDANDEGWSIAGDAQGASVLPSWYSSGGNPGGYIAATDDVAGGVWYFRAPLSFHGDFTTAYNTTLVFDLKQSRTSSQFNSVDVYLRGGGLELTFDTAYNPGTNWTSYSLLLAETGEWKLNGSAPTQAQMLQVLANITDLQIRGEYVTGSDTGSLDNVRMVPEPATMMLLGLGVTLIRRK